jgi:hypothetical protein
MLLNDDNVETSDLGIVRFNAEMSVETASNLWHRMRKACSLVDRAGRAIQFILGDFMLHSEKLYGQQAYQIFDHDDWRRLRNWRWVCSNIPVEQRYNEDWVTYAHYRLVVPLDQEKRTYYLGRVVNEMLTARDLAAVIRGDALVAIIETLPKEDKDFWYSYAEQTNCSVDEFRVAVEKGRGWAAENVNLEDNKTFETWYRTILTNDGFIQADFEGKLRLAWKAGQK